MSYKEFKLNDVVRCISNHYEDKHCKNKIGKIISIDIIGRRNPYTVEFFEEIELGHDGLGLGDGKNGCCWSYLAEKDIKLYQPILKIFLKEKQNEYIYHQ